MQLVSLFEVIEKSYFLTVHFTGGIRASIYNALPEEDVDTLIEYMNEFQKTHAA